MTKTVEILGRIVDLLRSEGVNIDNPYDFENWMHENVVHSRLFETGRFEKEKDD